MPERTDTGPLRIGDVFLEKYQILELMGRGGFGCVYHAESLFMAREVAVKVTNRQGGLTEELRSRGQQEAVALGRLGKHPNIVEVHDAGISPKGHLYLVMELLKGQPLSTRLLEGGPLGIVEGLTVLASLCDALEFARAHRVVHRDLKPANIFLEEDGVAKVLDFGVAKIAGSAGFQTGPNVVVGTSLYLSPEQIRGQPASHRSDIYALGLVAFQMLHGQHPLLVACPDLNWRDRRVVWDLHVRHPAPRLDHEIPGFPEYIGRLINTAIVKNPGQRYANAAEFAKHTRAALVRYESDLLEAQQREVPPCIELSPRVERQANPPGSAETEKLFRWAFQDEAKRHKAPFAKADAVGPSEAPPHGAARVPMVDAPSTPMASTSTNNVRRGQPAGVSTDWRGRLKVLAVAIAGLGTGLALVFVGFPLTKNTTPPFNNTRTGATSAQDAQLIEIVHLETSTSSGKAPTVDSPTPAVQTSVPPGNATEPPVDPTQVEDAPSQGDATDAPQTTSVPKTTSAPLPTARVAAPAAAAGPPTSRVSAAAPSAQGQGQEPTTPQPPAHPDDSAETLLWLE